MSLMCALYVVYAHAGVQNMNFECAICSSAIIFTPRAHAQQGVKQSFCPSVVVVVVVNTKMARSA